MKRFILISLLSLLTSVHCLASDFKVNGIYYDIINDSEVAVSGKTTSEQITIPSTVTYQNKTYNVTTIGQRAFFRVTTLTKVALPNSLRTIESEAFRNCTNLQSITIPNGLTTIGYRAFSGCTSLSSISLPEKITKIGSEAFWGCSSICDVYVRNINPDAYQCSNDAFSDKNFDFSSYLRTAHLHVPLGCISAYSQKEPWRNFLQREYIYLNTDEVYFSWMPEIEEAPTYQLTVIRNPNDDIDRTITWKSTLNPGLDPNDLNLASIDDKGLLTACYSGDGFGNVGGSITVYAYTQDNQGNTIFSNYCSVINHCIGSWDEGRWFHFYLDREELTLCPGEVVQLTATYETGIDYSWGDDLETDSRKSELKPDRILHDAKWTSSNESVATVDQNGFVTAIGVGTATITAFFGEDARTCVVAVKEPIQFADANVKAKCIAKWDINGDGELSEMEASVVTNLGSIFNAKTDITSFDELQYFTGLTSIGESAFSECSSLTSIIIPESVTSIGKYAFSSCRSLTSITIPESVTSIGESAFSTCRSLTSVTIPESVTSIGKSVFSQCSGLTSIIIPESITNIGDYAFKNCSGLTSIIIPESVTTIGDNAFYGCSNLIAITIPKNVTNIGNTAFSGLSSLETIVVEAGNTKYDSRNNCNAIINKDTNTLITGCKNTIIPESVISINDNAFSGCKALTSIDIPEGIKSIGKLSFNGCSSLTSIKIPQSVTAIGDCVFNDCKNLLDVYCYAGQVPNVDIVNGRWANDSYYTRYVTLHVPSVSLNAYSATDPWSIFGNFVAIDDIDYPVYAVTNISLNHSEFTMTYEGKIMQLNAIIEPENATNKDVTWESSNEGVAIVDENGLVTAIDKGVATITATTQDGNKTASCTVTVKMPVFIHFADATVKDICVAQWDTNHDGELSKKEAAAVKDLGNDFQTTKITSFNELQYFTGLTSIDYNTFYGCRSLTSVTIPESVTIIGTSAFSDCSSLTSVTLPASVATIENFAFVDCSSLTTVTIPKSVTYIDQRIFKGCNNLHDVYCLSEQIPDTHKEVFYDCYSILQEATLHVPSDYLDIYKEATPWKDYFKEIVDIKYATNINLNESEFTMTSLGSTKQLNAIITPTDAANKRVTWSSSNTAIATVSSTGLVTATGNGTATITATANDGSGVTATCKVINRISELSDLRQLSNTKQYLIHTRNIARGSLGVANGELASTNPNAQGHYCKKPTPFAILYQGGKYYLYSINDHRFFRCTGAEGESVLVRDLDAITLTMNKYGYYRISFGSKYLNVNNNPGIIINTYGDPESEWDDGNQFIIEEVGDFDPTGVFDNITLYRSVGKNSFWDNQQYAITTEWNGKRYFLDKQGYLTENATTDCLHTFSSKSLSQGYAPVGWQLDAMFTNPKLTHEKQGSIARQGHLLTSTQGRLDWEAQVWLQGENGKYAVRSTNATGTEWGANTYWAVMDNNGDNLPEADYSLQEAFVWELQSFRSVESIKMEPSTATMTQASESRQLTVNILPDNATNKSLTWNSSDESVATVDDYGNVTATGNGTATITATTQDGTDLSASCSVYVNIDNTVDVTNIYLNTNQLNFSSEGEVQQLYTTIEPDNATNQGVTWTSSDESVATVDENGNVTAMGNGTTVITATTEDGSYSDACYVTVAFSVIIPGDVNGDNDVDVADIVAEIDYVLGAMAGNVDMKGDVNGDRAVDVADIVAVIDYVLEAMQQQNHAPAYAHRKSLENIYEEGNELTATTTPEGIRLSLCGSVPYTAFQFLLTLPGGVHLEEVIPDAFRTKHHSLMFREISIDRYLVLGYAQDNRTIRGTEGTLLDMLIANSLSGVADLSDIRFVTAKGERHRLQGLTVDLTTGLEEMNKEKLKENHGKWYDLSGRRVNNAALHRGIYLNNGKKVVKK